MTSSRPVRVRIAPSPTGYFHLGTARTAIYNYLFAKGHGGRFVLRIEDTDVERSQPEFVEVILDGLRWLGVRWDEGPIHQADRQPLYAPLVERLLSNGRAYRCYCTSEELEAERDEARKAKRDWHYSGRCRALTRPPRSDAPFAVRLKTPPSGQTTFADLVAGRLARRNTDIEDFVIARSDGRALYQLAVVADDQQMQITHVIRGNDHITNTFKQLLLYRALDWEPPAFAHLPLILRPDKSKLSKRRGDPSVLDYRTMGYLPEAVVNYLSLLGWSAGDDREFYTLDELAAVFTLERVHGANPVFDAVKLGWMNGEYIRRMPAAALAQRVAPYLADAGLAPAAELEARASWLVDVVAALQERCKLLADFVTGGAYFFRRPEDYDAGGVAQYFHRERAPRTLRRLAEAWAAVRPFAAAALEAALQQAARAEGVKPAHYIHPARLALSGLTKGPGLYRIAELLGPDECGQRLLATAEKIADGRVGSAGAELEEKSR